MKNKRSTLLRQEKIWGYIFLIPFFVGFIFFIIGPIVVALGLSMTQWDLIGTPKFISLANYQNLFRDNLFWIALKNTLYYTFVSLPITIILSLILALLMNRKLIGIKWYRSVYFLPVTISIVAVSLLWAWMYSPDFGIINYIFSLIGLPQPGWISVTSWAMPSVIIMSIWRSLGFNIIILLAGLQNIDRNLYEAAAIDGAGPWLQFKSITIPMLSSVLFFVIVIGLINSFQVFEQTYIMTQGGPGYSTFTLVYYIFQAGFQFLRMGYASAMSFVLFIIIFLITAGHLSLQSKWVYYE
jgi:multiple sugar transport system permease protein